MNQLASNPWIIETLAEDILHDAEMPHVQVEFVDYDIGGPTIAHVEVQDRNGRTVAYLKGKPNGETVRTGRIGWVHGLKVPVLDSDGFVNMASGFIILYFE